MTVKEKIWINPDLTEKERKENKRLRDLLKEKIAGGGKWKINFKLGEVIPITETVITQEDWPSHQQKSSTVYSVNILSQENEHVNATLLNSSFNNLKVDNGSSLANDLSYYTLPNNKSSLINSDKLKYYYTNVDQLTASDMEEIKHIVKNDNPEIIGLTEVFS